MNHTVPNSMYQGRYLKNHNFMQVPTIPRSPPPPPPHPNTHTQKGTSKLKVVGPNQIPQIGEHKPWILQNPKPIIVVDNIPYITHGIPQ